MNIESFKVFFNEIWHNQPNTVIGAGTAIFVMFVIYNRLLNKYQ